MKIYGLTVRQMKEVTKYIKTRRDEVENEYRQVLDLAERNRRYWEERNRERLAQIPQMP
jgi:hypothetical protein